MNEPLERSVKRQRLIGICIAILLICALAIGGLITTMPANQEPGHFWDFLPWVRAARERAAREEALRVEQAAEAERRAAEAKRGEDPAKKEP